MQTYKKYLLSSAITFFSGFSMVLVLGLGSGTVEYSKAGLLALILTAVRAGFKVLGEWMVSGSASPAVLG